MALSKGNSDSNFNHLHREPDTPELLKNAVRANPFKRAFSACRSELVLIPQADVKLVNFDVTRAFPIMVKALPNILEHRDQMTKLVGFEARCVDKLETYGLCAVFAQNEYAVAVSPVEPAAPLAERLIIIRDLLNLDIEGLVKRGLLSGVKLPELKGTTGYQNLSSDVEKQVQFMSNHWDKIGSRASTTLEDLEIASNFAFRLLRAALPSKPDKVASATDEWRRAFTLFSHAYDQVRRALTYIRWTEADVDQIAPSFYGGGKAKQEVDDASNGDAAAAGDTATTGTSAPVATGTTGTATASPATGAATANPMVTPGPAVGAAKALAEAAANPEIPPARPFSR